MSLKPGDQEPPSEMTAAIYDQIRAIMEPDLQGLSEEDLKNLRKGWLKLSFAIASGVIKYITANMEIYGIKTKGEVQMNEVVFTQSNDGTGHVR